MNTTLLTSDDRFVAEDLAAPADKRKAVGNRTFPMRLDNMARRGRDDRASRGMILHKFAARSVDQMAALERAFDSGNAPELARGAQALKGVAAGLSAHRLCDLAEELQRTAERGELAEAGSGLVRMREEIDRCVEVASTLLGKLLDEHLVDASA